MKWVRDGRGETHKRKIQREISNILIEEESSIT